jgi:hypothetical protein
MKTMIKNVVLLVVAFTLFVSCKKENSGDKKSILVDWDLTCIGGPDTHQIDSTAAIKALVTYKTYIDSVKDTLTKDSPKAFPDKDDMLNYGVQVEYDLLLEVLTNIKYRCEDKLYFMNAIRPKKTKDGKHIEEELVTETIIVIESKDKAGNIQHMYFDFTRPCPNGCPDNLPIKYTSVAY